MKFLLIGVGLAVSAAGSALAADLPRAYTKAPAYVAPTFSWTGFYAGVHAGYGFGDQDNAITTGLAAANVANVAGGARPASVRLDRDGFIGGGQIGYNWQSNAWVYGIEADISYTDFRSDRTVFTVPLAGGAATLANNFHQELEYLGTVRGRLGYSWGWTMAYVTGGLAYGGVKNQVNFFGPAGQLQFTGSNNRTETGFTVGGGVEHAFTPNWTAKAEYLYYDLGSNDVNVAVIPGSGGGGTGYNTRFENNGHIVRVGLNYKFGW